MKTYPIVKNRSSRERYTLIRDGRGMGGSGKPDTHAERAFVVVNGVDRGNGYQGYMSVGHFLGLGYIHESAKLKVKTVLRDEGFEI